MNRFSKYSLQSALDLTDGLCRYLIQDRCWGPQEILDAEVVVYDFQADAEQMLRECIACGDPTVIGRLRYFLAEDCRVHFVHKMDDRRVVSETARQLSQYSYQVVLEPGLGWAVQVDAATAAPVLPVAVEPEPEVTGALAELKVVLDELVGEQRKKYAQYEAKLATLSDADKAALYGQKAGAGLWESTIGGAVGLVKALPGFAAGYFKTLCKIAMLPSELATATARSLATGDMAPLKAEADKFVQPLVKTYDQAVYYKSALVTLYEDEQTMGVLNDFANDYWESTHPLERTEMGASAAADIVVTILLALVTAGVGAAANIASKSTRLAKAAKLLDKIAGMLKRTGHRHKMPKKEIDASAVGSMANKRSRKTSHKGMPEPEKPKVRTRDDVVESSDKRYANDNKSGFKNAPKEFTNIDEANNWGTKHYDEWVNNLSHSEKESITDYTATSYQNINGVLRGTEKTYSGNNAEIAENISRALKRADVPEDLVVYRGASKGALGPLKTLPKEQMIGKVIEDKGFMSTSILKSSSFNGDIKLKINVPKGTKGAYLGKISCYPNEAELLLDKGQKMIITEVAEVTPGKMLLTCDLLPQ
ncbi:MAG: ADP-ribosyltransferase [Desulfobacterales bacterium]|nr:ADP-ribosyltransferase [Desulfobacterales bacterium]